MRIHLYTKISKHAKNLQKNDPDLHEFTDKNDVISYV